MVNQMFLSLATQMCYYKARVRQQVNRLASTAGGPEKDKLRKQLIDEREAAKKELIYMFDAHVQARRFVQRILRKQEPQQQSPSPVPVIHDPNSLPDFDLLIDHKIFELTLKDHLNFLYDENPDVDIYGEPEGLLPDNLGSMKTGSIGKQVGVHFSNNLSSESGKTNVIETQHGNAAGNGGILFLDEELQNALEGQEREFAGDVNEMAAQVNENALNRIAETFPIDQKMPVEKDKPKGGK